MIHKGKIVMPYQLPQEQRVALTAITAAMVAWLTSSWVTPQDVTAHPWSAALLAGVSGAVLAVIYGWFFSKRPETSALTRYFVIVAICLPVVFLGSFFLALDTYGAEAVLEKNRVFDWPNYLADDILLAIPAFAVAAGVYLLTDQRPRPTAEPALGASVQRTLEQDWMRGFWIEPVLHANTGVIACVVMGTGALANRLALWLALWFLATSLFQLVLWAAWRVRGKIPPIWVCAIMGAAPFVNWARFPELQEHGIEAVGGGIGMWTIGFLTTAVLSARRMWITLFVLTANTVAVAYAFYDHQHADGWFEQSTIAFLVGSFGLVIALATYDIYRKGTQNRHDLANALSREREARERAAVETERRRRILRAVGHDLRHPLSALQLWLYTSQQKQGGGNDDYNEAMASVSSAHEILDSIAQLSLMADGEKKPRPGPVDLDIFLEDLCAETRPLAEAADMAIRCHPLTVTVTTDAFLLRRIIRNFIVNAIKHGADGDILVAARRRRGGVEILVMDQGPGVDEAAQEGIFQEFTSTAKEGDGIGIGLTVAKDLADALGLEVIFRSVLGKGSTFGVWIPPGD